MPPEDVVTTERKARVVFMLHSQGSIEILSELAFERQQMMGCNLEKCPPKIGQTTKIKDQMQNGQQSAAYKMRLYRPDICPAMPSAGGVTAGTFLKAAGSTRHTVLCPAIFWS